jgi:hypothetical protein
MKYDMSKTLNENKQVIKEQPSPEAVASMTAGAALGSVIPVSAAVGTLTGGAALSAGAASLLTLPVLLPAAAAAAAAYGLYELGNWMANKDYGKDGFIQIMSVCKASGASKLVPKMSKSEIRDLAYQIEDAKGSWNDDEDAIVSVFQKVESIADLCSLDKKVTGGLVKFLDDLTDSPSEWKMFTRPIAGMIEDTEIILPDEEPKKTGGTKTTKYKVCSGTYTQGCYSEVIKQVQGCLGGLVTDGKFGPKTNEKLKSAGFSSGFSDNDVDKICDKTDIDTDVSGEEIVINQNEI